MGTSDNLLASKHLGTCFLHGKLSQKLGETVAVAFSILLLTPDRKEERTERKEKAIRTN